MDKYFTVNYEDKKIKHIKMKRFSVVTICLLVPLLLLGCTGVPNPAKNVFDNGQRWTAQEMEIFFDWDNKYYSYQNCSSPNVGCISDSGIPKQYFYIGVGSEANLDFLAFVDSDRLFATGYFIEAPDEYTYRVKIGNSQDEELLPNGTILTFTREDIAEDELFMPDVLGEYEGASPSTLLPSDSSSSNSSTS